MEFLNVYVNVNLVSTYIFSLYQYWYKIFCFLLYPISSMLCNATYFIALPRCLWNWSNRYNSVVNQKQTVFSADHQVRHLPNKSDNLRTSMTNWHGLTSCHISHDQTLQKSYLWLFKLSFKHCAPLFTFNILLLFSLISFSCTEVWANLMLAFYSAPDTTKWRHFKG